MVEEYDPDGFSVRVSQSLFHALSGRAAEPGLIEPRTPREAALIDAVRKEGNKERMAMLQNWKEDQLKEAEDREQYAEQALIESGKKLQEKLKALKFPPGEEGSASKPCASFRNAITFCYKVNKDNPLACAGEVEAFTECAKQLSRISNQW